MDLSLDDTQKLIQESARDFVRTDGERDILLGYDRNPLSIKDSLWPKMARLGWTGMAIPEAYGGTENSMTDIAVLFEELGTGPVPGPLFSSAIFAVRLLLEAATDAQKETWLPQIASGERIFVPAVTETQFGWSPEAIRLIARKDGSGHSLTGCKIFVHDALLATDLLVIVRLENQPGISMLRLNASMPGIAIRPLDGFVVGLSEVTFDNVPVAAENVVGSAGIAWEALERATLTAAPVLCAYKIGGCRAVFDMSVEYSRERSQFGQPIGRFQRVQDHVIHIVNYLDAARWTTYEALWKLDSGADARTGVHMAKSVASESYLRACDYGHEVHAGIGVVREYGLTLHTKMSRSLYHCLGAPKVHRRYMERTLDLVPA